MVFRYAASGVPLSRIDSSAFMIGNTGTCYRRGKAAWKGTLVLSGARGGLVNTYYGDVTLLNGADRAWFAKVQHLFLPLQASGTTALFGEYPGSARPYGFTAHDERGTVCTVLNPAPVPVDLELPVPDGATNRVLFTDNGAPPRLDGKRLHLGPGQLVVVGSGGYSEPRWDLGFQEDVQVPMSSEALDMKGVVHGPKSVSASVMPPLNGVLRIIGSQVTNEGRPWRVTGGAPPSGSAMGKILVLKAEQGGKEVPLSKDYDRQVWSGLSWAVAEVPVEILTTGVPVQITYTVDDPKDKTGVVDIGAYAVAY
jgi:hypothetical protein